MQISLSKERSRAAESRWALQGRQTESMSLQGDRVGGGVLIVLSLALCLPRKKIRWNKRVNDPLGREAVFTRETVSGK